MTCAQIIPRLDQWRNSSKFRFKTTLWYYFIEPNSALLKTLILTKFFHIARADESSMRKEIFLKNDKALITVTQQTSRGCRTLLILRYLTVKKIALRIRLGIGTGRRSTWYTDNKKLYTVWTRGVFNPSQYWFSSVFSANTEKQRSTYV